MIYFNIYNKIDKGWKFYMYFGAVIKNIRESQGFSLSDIQKITGIKESQLCRIESGSRFPTNEQIILLSNIYNLDQKELLIQRDSDKLLETIKDLQYTDDALDVAKEKLDSNGNYLSVAAEKLPGAAIALESRRYIGCKAKLLDWMFEIINNETTGVKIAVDIFAGTGVVAKRMLNTFDSVIVNDLLYSNNHIYKAFFMKGNWNKTKILNKLEIYNNLNVSDINDNYFSMNYGDKYFDYDMAKKIGWIREDIESSKNTLTEKEYAILISTLIYNIDKYANTLGHFEAYIKKPIKKSELKLRMIDVKEFENLKIYREDSNDLACKIKADLVYIDPPYNSRQYCRFYHVYETLVKWDKPILSGVAMKPPAENMSKYCTSQAPKTFEDLINKLDTKYLVVSYNNTYNSKSGSSRNKIELEEIKTVLNKKGETKIFMKDYRFFQSGKSNFENHQELLFVTKVK